MCRRAQAVANAWRAVEGVMADWRISKRLRDTGPNYNNKGCKYAEKNWVRKIVRVTRADRGRMVELRQTTQESG